MFSALKFPESIGNITPYCAQASGQAPRTRSTTIHRAKEIHGLAKAQKGTGKPAEPDVEQSITSEKDATL